MVQYDFKKVYIEETKRVRFAVNIYSCSIFVETKLILQKFLRIGVCDKTTLLSWQNYVQNRPEEVVKI